MLAVFCDVYKAVLQFCCCFSSRLQGEAPALVVDRWGSLSTWATQELGWGFRVSSSLLPGTLVLGLQERWIGLCWYTFFELTWSWHDREFLEPRGSELARTT